MDPVYTCAASMLKRLLTVAIGTFYFKSYIMTRDFRYLLSKYCNHYQSGSYSVSYNGHKSYSFNATQGVFQGSILSPHLYNIYTEELLKEIEESCTIGTSIHGVYSGIVAYADDIILISSTVSGLQSLLDECTKYFETTAISLNIGKTEFIGSHAKRKPTFHKHINIKHYLFSPGDKLKHLGFTWSTSKSGRVTLDETNVEERLSKFWAATYSLIKGGIRFCHPSAIVDMYRMLLVPTLTYGLELTHLSQTEMDKLDREGRKALKHLFNFNMERTIYTPYTISNNSQQQSTTTNFIYYID